MSVKPELADLTPEAREARRTAVVLRERYTPPEDWRCPVCHGPMTIARVGGGEATKRACASVSAAKDLEHYQRSVRWETGPGDRDVVALTAFVLGVTRNPSSARGSDA